jgi:hypothetical protein
MPIGACVVGLSALGQEVLQILVETNKLSSPTAKKTLPNMPTHEAVPVMEGIINHLRQTSDWTLQPKGFAGGCLLAQYSTEAAKTFTRFINGLKLSTKPPWLSTLLKTEAWYKE